MTGKDLLLCPFPASGPLPDIKLKAAIVRLSETIDLRFELTGLLEDLSIPARAETPSRRDGLWEDTCFELFIRTEGSDKYWEINLSPSGDWNVYRFRSYREGMVTEDALKTIAFDVDIRPDAMSISFELALEKINLKGRPLLIAASAVIKSMSGRKTYWALSHPCPRPDFHHRDSFIVSI